MSMEDVAGVVAVVGTLALGMAFILQDGLFRFFTSYYPVVVPIALTAGALAFFIALACKDVRKR